MKASQAILKQMVTSLSQSAAIQQAALGMVKDDGYCDFFVENGGDGKPFHEKCQTSDLSNIQFTKNAYSAQRMSVVQKLADTDGGYCDFFVENGGDGKPFHEKCQTSNIELLISNPAARATALGRLGVVAAFNKAELSALQTKG
jgi:hypothetical protein